MSTDTKGGSFPSRTSPYRVQEAVPEDLQARVDRLQELVCLLLAKNEKMRIALRVANAGEPLNEWLCNTPYLDSFCTSKWDASARSDSLPKP